MRGFIVGVLALTFLDVAVKAPTSRLATAVATPAAWLAKWMDPNTPLISQTGTTSTSSTSSTSLGETT